MELKIRGKVQRNVMLRKYTSMKVGGRAPFLIYPLDEEDLISSVKQLREMGITYRFLGNGTNVVVNDRGIKEALISLRNVKLLRYEKTKEKILAEVSGGTSLMTFIRENEKRGFSGLELLFSIPGTVGGAVKMNAGSFGVSISESLLKFTVLDINGCKKEIMKKKDDFGYRRSPLGKEDCLVSATFLLQEKKREEIQKEIERVFEERKRRHPLEYPSCGSVFKNVNGIPAWKYIEEAGLKGFRIGDACVSEKHANFIINLGEARAVDIKRLVEKIKKEVFERTGVMLEEEIEFWGFDD